MAKANATDDLDDELNEFNPNEWDDDAFQKRMDKVSIATKKLGELLLKGWTMLADHCQDCSTPLMSLRGGAPICPVCQDQDNKPSVPKPIAKPKPKPKAQQQQQISINSTSNQLKNVQTKVIPLTNTFDKEEKKQQISNQSGINGLPNDIKDKDNYPQYPPPPQHYATPAHCYYRPPPSQPQPHYYGGYLPHDEIFGFGPKQDLQMKRVLGDLVKTVLDRMSAINGRMAANSLNNGNNNLQNDIQELNSLMQFLTNVQTFKKQMRY